HGRGTRLHSRLPRRRRPPQGSVRDPEFSRPDRCGWKVSAPRPGVRTQQRQTRSADRGTWTHLLDGFMKVLIETAGDRILGFAMIGPEAGEVMAVVQTVMLDAILTHPTMAEGLNALFAAIPTVR